MKIWQLVLTGIIAAALAWSITPARHGSREAQPASERRPAAAEESARVSSWQAAIRGSGNRWDAMRGAVELAHSIPTGERMNWLQTKRFQNSDPLVVEVFLSELGRLAFDHDPAGFIASEINQENQRFRDYLREMAAANPQSVVELANGLENAEVRSACLKEAAFVLADRDPEALFKLIPIMPQADPELLFALKSAARGNAGRLLAVADTAGDSWKRLLTTSAVLLRAESDMSGALTWLGEQEDCSEILEILRERDDKTWPNQDLQKQFMENLAFAAGLLPEDWLVSFNDSEMIISDLTSYAPEVWMGVDLVRLGVSKQESSAIKFRLLQRLGLADPVRSAACYRSDTSLDDSTRKQIALSWVRQSAMKKTELPAELRAVIDPATLNAVEAMTGHISGSAPRPPAASIAEQLDRAASERDSWGLSLPTEVLFWESKESMAAAEAWAKSLPDDQIKNVANRVIHTGYVPPGLCDIILSRGFKLGVISEKDIRMWTSDMSKRAYQNPADTARSLAAYPAGLPRDQALQNIALRWNELDSKEASRWMNQLPEHDQKIATDAIEREKKWESEQTKESH